MTKIYLSPSSQWGNVYSYGNTNEAAVCGTIAKHAYNALVRNGFDVKVGPNDKNSGMDVRVSESNKWGADYHIPIHTNAGGGQGTVVFASSVSANNAYVKAVYNELAAISPGKDRNVRINDGLYEINSTKAICIYTETEFHDNANLAKWIVENTEEIGEAIARGFCKAEGKDYIGPDSKPVKNESAYKEEPKKSVAEVAKEVYAGKWGNGEERKQKLSAAGYNYDEVQAEVNKLTGKATSKPATSTPAKTENKNVKKAKEYAASKSNGIRGTYKVIAPSGLNVRHGAGTNKELMVTARKGTVMECYGYYTKVGNVLWYYVAFTQDGVTYNGFCSSEWIAKQN